MTSFSQTENVVKATGEKWEYNGKPLPSKEHRKVEYIGVIDSDMLDATFTLYGLLRESSGSIHLKILDGSKRMEGHFIGTAANTSGSVIAEKIE